MLVIDGAISSLLQSLDTGLSTVAVTMPTVWNVAVQ